MNRYWFKSFIASILSLAMVFTGTGVTAMADEPAVQQEEAVTDVSQEAVTDTSKETAEETHKIVPGYIRVPDSFPEVDDSFSYAEIRNDLVSEGEEEDGVSSKALMAEPLPSAYPVSYTEDWLSYMKNNYPATRNQGNYGTCWAHSAMTLAEFDMVKQGKPIPDYSELHLAYWGYTNGSPSIAGDTGDRVRFVPSDGSNILDLGGNEGIAAQTLMRRRGVAAESTAPYSSADRIANGGSLSSSTEHDDVAYLKNAYEINIDKNPDQVKEAIREHGAVGVCFYAASPEASDMQWIYNKDTNSFYDYFGSIPNHAMTVVGWDDNYPAVNFGRPNVKPDCDGAWLVRNSWSSTSKADLSSYFWLSYASKNVEGAYVFEFTDSDPYDNNYYYDSQTRDSLFTSNNSCWANVFHVPEGSKKQRLTAVSFEGLTTIKQGSNYVIEIYKNPEEGDPTSSGLVSEATTTGKIFYRGYYTIDLASPVTLNPGDSFAVVIRDNGTDDSNNTHGMKIAMEKECSNNVESVVSSQRGQSFAGDYAHDNLFNDPYRWWDTYNLDKHNIIISALTVNAEDYTDRSSLTLDKDSLTFSEKRKDATVTATVLDENGNEDKTTPVAFTIGDPSLAYVDVNGQQAIVSPKLDADGTTTLTANCKGLRKTINVTVHYVAKTPEIYDAPERLKVGDAIYFNPGMANAYVWFKERLDDTTKITDYNEPGWINGMDGVYVPEEAAGHTLVIDYYSSCEGYANSPIMQWTCPVDAAEEPKPEKEEALPILAEPENGNTVKAGDKIVLRSLDPTANLYYTINGTKPSATSSCLYTAPIVVSEALAGKTLTIKVFSTSDTRLDSEIQQFTYTIEELKEEGAVRLSLSDIELSLAKSGLSKKITATAIDAENNPVVDAEISFTSNAPSVATVAADGTVKAVAPGTAIITASCGDIKADCRVSVGCVVRFYVKNELYKEYAGVGYGATMEELPKDPSRRFKFWADSEGKYWNPKSEIMGDTDLFAVFDESSVSSDSAMKPYPDAESDTMYLVKGQTFTLDDKTLASSNKTVVAIAKNGKATAKNTGTAEIRTQTGEVLYTVTVIDPVLSSKSISLLPGETENIKVSLSLGREDLADKYPVAWDSSNPSIAQVNGTDDEAAVSGIAKGSATITAYVNGKAYKAKVKVVDTRAASIASRDSEITLSPLQSITLKLKGVSFKNAEWTSDHDMQSEGSSSKKVYYDGIAVITAAGKLTAAGSGTTTLKCSNGVTIKVTVTEPAERKVYIGTGKKQQLTIYGVKKANATWSCGEDSSAIDKAAFTKNGTIKGMNAGTADVYCTYNPYGQKAAGFTWKTVVYVENPALKTGDGLTQKNAENYELKLNGGADFRLEYRNDGAYHAYAPSMFTSSNPQVAYVDENGVIHTAKVAKKSTVNISSSAGGKKVKVKVTVMP